MTTVDKIKSFHIIEQDASNKWLMTWTYPTISDAHKEIVLQKLDSNLKFVYFRCKTYWFYIVTNDHFDNEMLQDTKQFSIVIISTDFQPDKYENLGNELSQYYIRTGSPVELVKSYIAYFVSGQHNGTFMIKNVESVANSTQIKDLINKLGLEIILLYTAILLKMRVVLYHHSQESLLKLMPTISALMLHRNASDFIYPIMEVTCDSLAELKASQYFVAGFTDSAIFAKTDTYDVLINLPATEITVLPHAKDSLTMSKTHKDIAMFMVQLAENAALSESEAITEISNKTQELLKYLKTFSSTTDPEHITIPDIQAKHLHLSIENFLIHLATAENLLNY